MNAAFKQIFGEALEPLGFVKIKSKYPYYVRLIGDEIIHVITYMPKQDKCFEIIGGVATVYRQYISLDKSPRDNSIWLMNNLCFHEKSNPIYFDPEFRGGILSFYYYDDEGIYKKGTYTPDGKLREPILEVIEHSLKITERYMLPILDNVIDIDSCFKFFHKFNVSMHLYDEEDFGNKYKSNFCNEWLLYLKNNHSIKHINKNESPLAAIHELNEAVCKDIYEIRLKQNVFLDKLHNKPKLYAKLMEELERRKTANIEILRSYGLDI